ncbi:MAG: hypothetical protein B6243_01290 [Anaerolineaceae bacterium 4572_5.2]|nr:MAG: hypothetical protein B6243_01290 [Anaerolineaceae bacterium 4572_5.2]
MFNVSARTLKIIAAIIWYLGGIILLLKGSSLLLEASTFEKNHIWLWLSAPVGILLGFVKIKYLFRKSCRKNLIRIDSLTQAKVWQFYRPGFIIFLILMIILGERLSEFAHGKYPYLIAVGILDIALSTALFGSSYVFWADKAFKNPPAEQ